MDDLLENDKMINALMINHLDAIYFKDLESRFVRSNNVHADHLGVNNPKELLGKTDFYFSVGSWEESWHDDQDVLRTGKAIVNKKEVVKLTNGKCFDVSTSKYPLFNNKEMIIGLIGFSRDITVEYKVEELELIEREINILNRILVKQNRQLEEYAYRASHNFLEPFSNKKAMLNVDQGDNIIDSSFEMKSRRKYVNRLNENPATLNTVLNPNLEEKESEVSLLFQCICVELMGIYKHRYAHRKIDFSRLKEVVYPEKFLRNILSNLISNSIEFLEINKATHRSISTDDFKN
jgi:PAS domain S-box-containing protein